MGQINATDAPVLYITDALPSNAGPGLTINATLNVTFLIQCPTQTAACAPQPAFTLGLGVYTALAAKVTPGFTLPNSTVAAVNVTGHMLNLEFNVSLASSHIGNFSMANLDMLLDMMLRAVALDMVRSTRTIASRATYAHDSPWLQINTKLEQGFLVPAQIGSLAFSNTTVAFGDGVVIIDTDAGLVPSTPAASNSRSGVWRQ